jgi:hypothetical protein
MRIPDPMGYYPSAPKLVSRIASSSLAASGIPFPTQVSLARALEQDPTVHISHTANN